MPEIIWVGRTCHFIKNKFRVEISCEYTIKFIWPLVLTTAHRKTKSQSLAAKKKFVFNEYDIKPRFYSVHILQEESSFLCKIIKK